MLKATKLRGGVMGWVFRSNQRYATRQAAYLGLLSAEDAPDDVMSGSGILGFMSKIIQLNKEKTAHE